MTFEPAEEHRPGDVRPPAEAAVEVSLPADLTAAAQARAYVHQCRDDLSDDTLGDVELIVSELVANAVLHGQPDIVLRLRVEPFAVDVAVLDGGDRLPPAHPTFSAPDATSGRGLALVDGLAHEWGIEDLQDRHGKVVWATIRR